MNVRCYLKEAASLWRACVTGVINCRNSISQIKALMWAVAAAMVLVEYVPPSSPRAETLRCLDCDLRLTWGQCSRDRAIWPSSEAGRRDAGRHKNNQSPSEQDQSVLFGKLCSRHQIIRLRVHVQPVSRHHTSLLLPSFNISPERTRQHGYAGIHGFDALAG